MDISHPHDSFFRYIVSKGERAIDLIRHQIPDSIAKYLNFETLSSEQDTFVDSKLKNRYSDALFKVQTVSDDSVVVYFLIDHKSSPESGVLFQLNRYINRIWERHDINHPDSSLPPVIGIVIYHGMEPWNIATDLKTRFDCPEDFYPYQPVYRYILIDLCRMMDNQLGGSADLRAAMMLMKYIFHPNLHDYVPMILRVLKEARSQPDFLAFFEACMLYLFNSLNKEHHKEVEKIVHIELPVEGGEVMPTVADMFREQGREEGLEQGCEELAKGILKLLQSKFHDLPQSTKERITSVHELSILAELMDVAIESESLSQFQNQMHTILSR